MERGVPHKLWGDLLDQMSYGRRVWLVDAMHEVLGGWQPDQRVGSNEGIGNRMRGEAGEGGHFYLLPSHVGEARWASVQVGGTARKRRWGGWQCMRGRWA